MIYRWIVILNATPEISGIATQNDAIFLKPEIDFPNQLLLVCWISGNWAGKLQGTNIPSLSTLLSRWFSFSLSQNPWDMFFVSWRVDTWDFFSSFFEHLPMLKTCPHLGEKLWCWCISGLKQTWAMKKGPLVVFSGITNITNYPVIWGLFHKTMK